MTRPEIQRARELRRAMTGAETKLWSALRNNRFGQRRFRRQHPIGPYTVDFVCLSAALVVEVDGGQHGTDEGMARDAARDEFLARHGYSVIRFWNFEVLAGLKGVLDAIDAKMMAMGVPVREPSSGASHHLLPQVREKGRGFPLTLAGEGVRRTGEGLLNHRLEIERHVERRRPQSLRQTLAAQDED